MSKVGLIVPTLNEGRLSEVWLKEFDRQTRKLTLWLQPHGLWREVSYE